MLTPTTTRTYQLGQKNLPLRIPYRQSLHHSDFVLSQAHPSKALEPGHEKEDCSYC